MWEMWEKWEVSGTRRLALYDVMTTRTVVHPSAESASGKNDNAVRPEVDPDAANRPGHAGQPKVVDARTNQL